MADQGTGKSVWLGVILVLLIAAVIGVFGLEHYYTQQSPFSTTMEQGFPPAPEPEPPVAMEADTPTVVATEALPNTETDTATTAEAEPATEKSEDKPPAKKMDAWRQKVLAQVVSQRAALVESGNKPWEVVPIGAPPPKGWSTLMIQNQYRTNYVAMPLQQTSWRIVEQNHKLQVDFYKDASNQKDILSRKNKGKYAVQMMSLEEKYFERGVAVVQMLVNHGYYAYLFRTPKKYRGQYWYRVRVGFYKTPEKAKAVGQEIYFRYRDLGIFPKNYWNVAPSPQELSSELVNLKIQRNNPWMIQLPLASSESEMLEVLMDVARLTDFLYVAQKEYSFRTRLGLFETQEKAQEQLKKWRRKNDALAKAKVVSL